MKIIIVVALVAVLMVLAAAGLFMLRGGRPTGHTQRRMAWALTLRVALSIAVFLFVLLAWQMGWIKPTGLPTGR